VSGSCVGGISTSRDEAASPPRHAANRVSLTRPARRAHAHRRRRALVPAPPRVHHRRCRPQPWSGRPGAAGQDADTPEAFSDELGTACLKAVTECSPQAQIVFERFHVQRLVQDAVDEVRRDEVRTAASDAKRKSTRGKWQLLESFWNLSLFDSSRLAMLQPDNACARQPDATRVSSRPSRRRSAGARRGGGRSHGTPSARRDGPAPPRARPRSRRCDRRRARWRAGARR
jgi:hypothetical protein